jgi:hypothetical protein
MPSGMWPQDDGGEPQVVERLELNIRENPVHWELAEAEEHWCQVQPDGLD